MPNVPGQTGLPNTGGYWDAFNQNIDEGQVR